MHRLHVILAILIAVSLTAAPLTPAREAISARAAMSTLLADTAAQSEKSDCHMLMRPDAAKACRCCDAGQKAPCPDAGACLAKCSVQVIAVLAFCSECRDVVVLPNNQPDTEKPPGWTLTPPAPPPRG